MKAPRHLLSLLQTIYTHFMQLLRQTRGSCGCLWDCNYDAGFTIRGGPAATGTQHVGGQNTAECQRDAQVHRRGSDAEFH